MPDEEQFPPFRVVVDVEASNEPQNRSLQRASPASVPRSLFAKECKDIDFATIEHEWQQCLKQVRALAASAEKDAKDSEFRLTEIDLGLTVTAEGHIAFVASASAAAVVQVKFTR